MAAPKTTLDTDNTKPAQTAPGDGPADTTDPRERASSVLPIPGPEALKAGTVNSQKPLDPIPDTTPKRTQNDRVEEYDAVDANGNTVRVVRNLETGERRFSKGADTGAIPTQPQGR